MKPAICPAKCSFNCSCVSSAMGGLLCGTDHPMPNDPLPFDLSGWKPVAEKVREYLKQMNGRNEDLTDIPEAA